MPVGAIELITMSEYGRRRGCSETAVRKAVKAGRISLIDGRVDPVAADAQWARNTRVRAGSRPADDANLQPGAPSSGGRAAGQGGQDQPDDYWHNKNRREKAEAELAELKLAEQRGELVRVADVRSAFSKRAAGLREALLQMPARLSAQLAAETEQARVHDVLQVELHNVLAQITQD